MAALALVVGSASGATTRFLVEVFGSSSQPSFPADRGIAIDQGSGALHVIDSTNGTLSRFNANGTALNFSALSSNVIDGEGAGDGTAHGHLGFSSNAQREQVAIDESGGATDGNIYVTQSEKDVIDIFSSTGAYLGQLSESTATAAFGEPCGVAVDSSGTVYVGDREDDRIHVYGPAGAFPVNADNTTSFSTLTDPCTLAAGSGATAGFLFAASSGGGEVSKLDAATGEVKYQVTSGGTTVSTDPANGHLFVARNTGAVDEFDASGATEATLVSSFKPGGTVEGIAPSSGPEQLYVARSGTEKVEVFGPAVVVPEVVSNPPSSKTGFRATLAGTVDPDGVELDECFFEWGLTTSFGNIAPCAEAPAAIGSGTAPVPVHADISGLRPQGTSYSYRLVAVNPNATVNGSDQSFTAPDTVFAQAATGTTTTEATLHGTVNPDTATISECVFEWGPKKGLSDVVQEFPEATPCVPGPGGIGTGTSPVAVQAQISGLHPGTTYVYRLKATYPAGVAIGPTEGQTISVQTSGPVIKASWAEDVVLTEAILKTQIDPEGSPTTYHIEYGETEAYGSETPELSVGSDSSVHLLSQFLNGLQSGTTYHYRVVATNAAAVNEGPDQIFTTFEPAVQNVNCPNQAFRVGPSAGLPDCRAYEMVSPLDKNNGDIVTFDSTITAGLDQAAESGEALSYSSYRAFGDAPNGSVATLYFARRDSDGWTTRALGAPLNGRVTALGLPFAEVKGLTPDLSTALLVNESKTPNAPGAINGFANLYGQDTLAGGLTALTTVSPEPGSGTVEAIPEVQGFSDDGSHVVFRSGAAFSGIAPSTGGNKQLYESVNGQMRLVSVLPNGEPNLTNASAGTANNQAVFGTENSVQNAISRDGSRIFWTASSQESGPGAIYVRVNGTTTVPVAVGPARFRMASRDGGRVLFTNAPGFTGLEDLYRFDVDNETATFVAAINGVVGGSDDLSRIYFVSKQNLDAGATAGEFNLYLYDEEGISFIATLPAEDMVEVNSSRGHKVSDLERIPDTRTSRVSASGRFLIFETQAKLTGYDNTDAVSGEPNGEVFRYDALDGELICVSCNPSGARPRGRNLGVGLNNEPSNNWFAATIPAWKGQLYQPRALSEDGRRVFFNSFDALLPQDTNGKQDVYMWEEQGAGTCEMAGGCVDLISTGESAQDSRLVDSSVDGDDVFIATTSSIAPGDPGLVDIYDVRVDGGFQPPPPPPVPCVGDSCQSPPSAPDDPTAASATFRGAGDPKVGTGASCGRKAGQAAELRRRARDLRRRATGEVSAGLRKSLHKRSVRLAGKARRLSENASRCRRSNRRAG